ncbi:MAG: T9SS type A sorting domain-containing protein [Ignavibacteria bacterium]|nr:T9SS type A sorting domain-containing protein [Ignavibacteria bacterium]
MKKIFIIKCFLILIGLVTISGVSYSQLVHDFRVNQDTGLQIPKYYTKISSNVSGKSVVVWQDNYKANIFAQLFDYSFRRIGINLSVNNLKDTCLYPDVIVRNDGTFGVVWIYQRSSGSKLFLRLFTREGLPISSDMQLNDTNYRIGMDPQLGCDSSGRFVVVWSNLYNDIVCQIVDSAGNKIGNNKKVNEGNLSCNKPSILVRKDGSFIIAWADYMPPGSLNKNIFMQMYDRNGNKIGTNRMVNDDTVSLDDEWTPFVAGDSLGNFTIAFNEWILNEVTNYVYYQRYDKNGVKLGSNKILSQVPGNVYVTGFDSDGSGNLIFLLNIHNASSIYLFNMRVDKNDNPIGTGFPVTLENPYEPKSGCDVVLNNNRIINLWTEARDCPQPQIYANVRSFTNPDSTVEVRNISAVVPGEYKLYQNYPNPFNPVTKIKFDVPENGKLKPENGITIIKVYDLLGREIKTLVNEKLNPGSYEVTFDGSRLSSGIYFYRLTINDKQLAIKKMILLK